MKKMIRKLLSFTLIISMVMSMSVTAFAAELPKLSLASNFSQDVSLQFNEKINDIVDETINKAFNDDNVSTQSAGLAWGPVKIGNLELKITNAHDGYVYGLGYVNHVNFHIAKTSNGRDIANYHIVKYTSGTRDCLYVYESVAKKVVINRCYNNWTSAVGDVVSLAQDVVKAALSEADWLATIAIWAVVAVVIVDLIVPMDPIPIIPLSTEPPLI